MFSYGRYQQSKTCKIIHLEAVMVDTTTSYGVSFQLTDEQQMLQKMARDFTAKEITPVAAAYDEQAKFPDDIYHKAFGLGLVNLNIPAAYGGMGASVFEECLVAEELGYGCTGISTSLSTNSLAALPILLAGTEAQKAYWLGERLMDNEEIASYGVTEAAAGSDVAGIETRAEKKNGSYMINGSKTFITNASHASFFCVFAKTDPAARHRGMSCFVVDRAMPGVSVGKKFDKLGQRASDTAEIVFENVEVPAENLIGEEGQGFYLAMQVFDRSRPGVAGRGRWGCSAGHWKNRCGMRKNVRPSAYRSTSIRRLVTRSRIWQLIMRPRVCLVWQSAWQADSGIVNPRVPAYAKAFAADMATKAAVDAVQVFGGYGYMKEYPVEKIAARCQNIPDL